MPVVADVSVVVSWIFADETTPESKQFQDIAHRQGIVVPLLFHYEIRNVLCINEKRNRIAQTDTVLFLEKVAALISATDPTLPTNDVLTLARTHALTVYDAAYLELCLRQKLPLMTFDKKLAAAAVTAGVEVHTL
jgi:predicted nucleic acid-binding protein